MATMSCKAGRYRYMSNTNYGRVLNFLPLDTSDKNGTNGNNGLTLKITGNSRCWDRSERNYKTLQTIIKMICDLGAGIGYPEMPQPEISREILKQLSLVIIEYPNMIGSFKYYVKEKI